MSSFQFSDNVGSSIEREPSLFKNSFQLSGLENPADPEVST